MNIEAIGKVRMISSNESALEIDPAFKDGLHGIALGDRLQVLYWMHELDTDARKVLKVHPRGDETRPLKGVFGVRSPMRPNPIGVSSVQVARIEADCVVVTGLDAFDGSPVIDIKSDSSQGHSAAAK